LKEPEAVSGVPVVLIPVEDDDRVVGDAVATQQGLEVRLVHEVAANGVLHVDVPVELDGVANVAHALVQQRVFVGFNETHLGVVEMVRNPLGVNQNLRMNVTSLCGCTSRAALKSSHRTQPPLVLSRHAGEPRWLSMQRASSLTLSPAEAGRCSLHHGSY